MNPYEVGEASGYSDWLLACAMKNSSLRELRNFANKDMIKLVDTDFSVDLNFVDFNEDIIQNQAQTEKASSDKETVELIKEKIEYKLKVKIMINYVGFVYSNIQIRKAYLRVRLL